MKFLKLEKGTEANIEVCTPKAVLVKVRLSDWKFWCPKSWAVIRKNKLTVTVPSNGKFKMFREKGKYPDIERVYREVSGEELFNFWEAQGK